MTKLPEFQQLQNAFTQAIRHPETIDFLAQKQPGLVKFNPEKRRLDIYQSLFFNNLLVFFNSLFPILSKQLGEPRCQALVREFMQQHHAQTPLFHELGQEFLAFLQTQYQPKPEDPAYVLELAHYEWVELAVSIEPQEGPLNAEDCLLDWQAVYQLSPVAWPVAYEWPVHEMQATVMTDKPEWPTFLLVFRDDEDAVQQMVLSPILYELLLGFMDNQTQTAEQVLSVLAEQVGQPREDLQGFAEPILQQFIEQNLLGFVE